MAQQWRGVIAEYGDHLPEHVKERVVTLGEGGTPLVPSPLLSELTGADVHLKVEGMNPTGSFKDRGMTTAISSAAARGIRTVICASTGNTSASAAAYATAAGMVCAVLVPDGKIAMGKLSQAVAHGARLLQVDGNFDDCLVAARKLAESYPVELVNSVNPDRIQGQKTAAFEIVDVLGDAPDVHVLPVGNAGNITAYWMGFTEYATDGAATHAPKTIATAIRIGNPASWQQALAAREESGGLIEAVTDTQILAAHRLLSARVGVFVEPASAAGVAGLLMLAEAGRVPAGARITVTVTGHGLKDPQWALRGEDGSPVELVRVTPDVVSIADALGLG